jgi:hypothetical protein
MAITKRIGSRPKEQAEGDAKRTRQAGRQSRKWPPRTFQPGSNGVCEAQLWKFTGPKNILDSDDKPAVERVAAPSLDQALKYMAERHEDFIIQQARCVCMLPLVAGSPLD